MQNFKMDQKSQNFVAVVVQMSILSVLLFVQSCSDKNSSGSPEEDSILVLRYISNLIDKNIIVRAVRSKNAVISLFLEIAKK